MEAKRKLNIFTFKFDVSRYYSLQSILSDTEIDYNKHCRYKFGTYDQALDEPNKKNE